MSKAPSLFSTSHVQCYHNHPPLPIKMADGTQVVIYGGNCGTPIVKDADIYIGFDGCMRLPLPAFPWNPPKDPEKAQHIYFFIQDMNVPKDAEEFKKMLDWVAVQLIAGKKIHAGCIGGHGRTGLFFSALVKHMTGNEDAITYVRENYCPKAVETGGQIEWLNKHFGIKSIAGSKKVGYDYGHAFDQVSEKTATKKSKPAPSGSGRIPCQPAAYCIFN